MKIIHLHDIGDKVKFSPREGVILEGTIEGIDIIRFKDSKFDYTKYWVNHNHELYHSLVDDYNIL